MRWVWHVGSARDEDLESLARERGVPRHHRLDAVRIAGRAQVARIAAGLSGARIVVTSLRTGIRSRWWRRRIGSSPDGLFAR
jgi:hypothetical protein